MPMLPAITILLICLLMPVGALLLWSHGRPAPLLDEDGNPLTGSLSEKIHVNINGLAQGMFIRSKDLSKPVLLFLHGGPGMPTYFLNRRYPADLENDFTVCWWEQRGAGLSYHAGMSAATLTVEQLIADTLEVTNYLRQRFGQDKIYLMGHSWGSFLGLQVAARTPEIYHAYIGISQVTYQLKSEKWAYDYMLQQFKANGNRRMARKLEQAPVTMTDGLPAAYNALRDDAMHSLGIGTTRDMRSVITGIFLRSWLSPEYTVSEKISLWRGKFFSRAVLWEQLLATDLTQVVTELKLPVYFVHGSHDYTTSYPEARAYFEQIKAPLKGFYTFEQSAHSPFHEQPEKMRQILREDVLEGAIGHADAWTEAASAHIEAASSIRPAG
ncbi:MAG: alpha/beta hydrolase [Anaerolineae bacterium]|nr:alpha/beta hydrolase [Anaerolineae bacterium]